MNLLWKVFTVLASALAAVVAQKAFSAVWEKGLGKTKPTGDESDGDLSLAQITLFAAVMAGINALVTGYVKRSLQRSYQQK